MTAVWISSQVVGGSRASIVVIQIDVVLQAVEHGLQRREPVTGPVQHDGGEQCERERFHVP